MNKLKKILGCLVLSLFTFLFLQNNVSALTFDEGVREIDDALDNYSFNFKYTDMSDYYKLIEAANSEDSRYGEEEFLKQQFLSGLVRSELDSLIDLTSYDMVDLFCYSQGDTYYDYSNMDSAAHGPTPKVAERDFCFLDVLIADGEGEDAIDRTMHRTLLGSFEQVEGNDIYKTESIKIIKNLMDDVYVTDMDMLNHWVNYKSNNSTFFEGNNALREFSDLKKIVEDNPDYEFL